MKILDFILELIFPTKCGICGKVGEAICYKCYENIKKFEIEHQHKDLFFVYRYEGIIRDLILRYKFEDRSYLYQTFVTCLLKNKKVCQFLKSYDIIIPVPLHKKRLAKRGYNQSELIASKITKELCNKENDGRSKTNKNQQDAMQYDTPICMNNVLIKNKNIKPQSEKGIKQRILDIQGVYEVRNIDSIKNKKVLLFDDIYTTGSTANECKKVLLEAGASKVRNTYYC